MAAAASVIALLTARPRQSNTNRTNSPLCSRASPIRWRAGSRSCAARLAVAPMPSSGHRRSRIAMVCQSSRHHVGERRRIVRRVVSPQGPIAHRLCRALIRGDVMARAPLNAISIRFHAPPHYHRIMASPPATTPDDLFGPPPTPETPEPRRARSPTGYGRAPGRGGGPGPPARARGPLARMVARGAGVDDPVGAAGLRQDHHRAASGRATPGCISSRCRRCSPASPI